MGAEFDRRSALRATVRASSPSWGLRRAGVAGTDFDASVRSFRIEFTTSVAKTAFSLSESALFGVSFGLSFFDRDLAALGVLVFVVVAAPLAAARFPAVNWFSGRGSFGSRSSLSARVVAEVHVDIEPMAVRTASAWGFCEAM